MTRHQLAWLFPAALIAAIAAGCKGSPPPTQDAATQESTPPPVEKNRPVILATTTSTQDTGLLDVLVPLFEKKTGLTVKTIAVGSGQAMAMGKRGDADVLLVHSPDDEKKFVEEGFGLRRRIVMHNDFVVVGPQEDKARIKGAASAAEALKAIAAAGALFVSRGDDSGTHKKEKKLWGGAGADPGGKTWYLETGAGMGQTLQVASEKGAYTLTDRGTYLALKGTLHLDILVEGDPGLFNVYHVIEVNPQKLPLVNADGARAFADFILSPEAQDVIRTFGTEKFGTPLFYPDAGKEESE
jgi:tungstate transport system substrate-binding protein